MRTKLDFYVPLRGLHSNSLVTFLPLQMPSKWPLEHPQDQGRRMILTFVLTMNWALPKIVPLAGTVFLFLANAILVFFCHPTHNTVILALFEYQASSS